MTTRAASDCSKSLLVDFRILQRDYQSALFKDLLLSRIQDPRSEIEVKDPPSNNTKLLKKEKESFKETGPYLRTVRGRCPEMKVIVEVSFR